MHIVCRFPRGRVLIKAFLSNIDSFTHLRFSWALGGALLFQLVGIYLLPIETYPLFTTIALAGSYSLLLLGLAANLRILGFKVLFAGAALNFLVIAFNGWRMPVTPEALAKAGFVEDASLALGSQLPDPKNVLLLERDTNLAFYSDIIPSTFPLHSVWSVGDLLIILGLGLVLIKFCKVFLSASGQPQSAPHDSTGRKLALKTLASAHPSKEATR
jgi:hypothetical protein